MVHVVVHLRWHPSSWGMCTLPRGAPQAPPERSTPLISSILHLLTSAKEPQAVEQGGLLVRTVG